MKLSLGAFLMSACMLTACEKDGPIDETDPNPPVEEPADTKAGTVSGSVVDSQGRPIAGARVRIENDWSYYDVSTNAAGKYTSPTLPPGGFRAVAWATIPYQGQDYTLRMGMPQASDYDYFDAKNGVVRNFKWQISGPIPDREGAYFGATLELMSGTGSIWDERMNPGDNVYVTLKPTIPLIDGSIGEVIERSFTIQSGNDTYLLHDIPAGQYEISCIRVTPDNYQEQLLIGTFSQQWEAALITFQPGEYGIGTYENGLKRLSLYMNLNR
ncbi:carboxypeptidase-like regulatory domain-containing protein [Cesiribacter sp. SM1]|uniref:carboxypeptidase-like regulatory domain-containing protein n=1 Tax=Cesiribacter sp. SM1 TaxID=2861196 RepID=UPI001CD5CA43|nr:carboxypeptidase-like regulatory domain-containing protein [Cesiribacter sp. SM1]